MVQRTRHRASNAEIGVEIPAGLPDSMWTLIAALASFALGAVADHYFEARSLAAMKKSLAETEARIIGEIRKKSLGV